VVDVTAASQPVTVTLTTKDTQSGVDLTSGWGGFLILESATQLHHRQVDLRGFELRKGKEKNCQWRGTLNLQVGTESGQWTVIWAGFADQGGNWWYPTDEELAGFPKFTVISVSDFTPPTVTVEVDPAQVDVSEAAQPITITMRVIDDNSGFGSASSTQLWDLSTALIQIGLFDNASTIQVASFERVSGTVNDGVWSATATIQRFSQPGQYIVKPIIRDNVGNLTQLELPILTVTSTLVDTEPPVLTKFTFAQASFSQSSLPQPIYATLEGSDNLSGAAAVVWITGPDGTEFGISFAEQPTDGPHSFSLPSNAILSDSPLGEWRVTSIVINDYAGNMRIMTSEDVAAAGLDASFTIVP